MRAAIYVTLTDCKKTQQPQERTTSSTYTKRSRHKKCDDTRQEKNDTVEENENREEPREQKHSSKKIRQREKMRQRR